MYPQLRAARRERGEYVSAVNVFAPELSDQGNGPYRLLRGARARQVEAFLGALDDPETAQRAALARILEGARESAFGREHGLERVRSLEDLRAAVPVRDHEGHRPWLDRVANGEQGVLCTEKVEMLLETSGTTGRPKHLPVTPSWARTVSDAQAFWILGLIRDHEALARGSALTVVSPAEHARSPGGLPIGANTGRMHLAQPWWLRLRYPVPYSVFQLAPTELKHYALLRFALGATITSITTANPSTILLLCRRLLEWAEPLSQDLRDGTLRQGPAAALAPSDRRWLEWRLRRRQPPTDWRPAKIWPLTLVNCWKGGPAAYFAARLSDALGAEIPVREVGVTASEGYFAVPLGDWDGGVLWTGGHLMEFATDDGQLLGAWELEEGQRARLVITTEAGLYRYDLDDVVEVIGRCGRTPVVRFVGKGRRVLNVLGERVTEEQVALAVRAAVAQVGLAPLGFTLGIEPGLRPRYRLAVELERPDARCGALLSALDAALMDVNVEYAGRRESGRLNPPTLVEAPAGTFLRYRQARVAAGAPEGQVKDPILALDDAEWARVMAGPTSEARGETA